MDMNGAIIEESKEIKKLNRKIVELDIKVSQVRIPSGKENHGNDKPASQPNAKIAT